MKKIEFIKNQTPLLNIDAPGEYQSLLNLDKSTFSILAVFVSINSNSIRKLLNIQS
jgi:hypothetical protein